MAGYSVLASDAINIVPSNAVLIYVEYRIENKMTSHGVNFRQERPTRMHYHALPIVVRVRRTCQDELRGAGMPASAATRICQLLNF